MKNIKKYSIVIKHEEDDKIEFVPGVYGWDEDDENDEGDWYVHHLGYDTSDEAFVAAEGLYGDLIYKDGHWIYIHDMTHT